MPTKATPKASGGTGTRTASAAPAKKPRLGDTPPAMAGASAEKEPIRPPAKAARPEPEDGKEPRRIVRGQALVEKELSEVKELEDQVQKLTIMHGPAVPNMSEGFDWQQMDAELVQITTDIAKTSVTLTTEARRRIRVRKKNPQPEILEKLENILNTASNINEVSKLLSTPTPDGRKLNELMEKAEGMGIVFGPFIQLKRHRQLHLDHVRYNCYQELADMMCSGLSFSLNPEANTLSEMRRLS